MQHLLKFFIMIIIIFMISISATSADYGDLIWEQQGNIRLRLGYLSGIGQGTDLSVLYDSFLYSYNLDLSGTIIKGNSNLNYSFKKGIEEELDWSFHWNNSWFEACYDKGVNLNFPEINLAFQKNAIDGFELHTLEDESSLTLFHGKEANFPMIIMVKGLMPGTTKIRLFDYHDPAIPASGGDIIEFSEIITADGVVLKPKEDYVLNYLNSDLSLLTTVSPETVIEAKFLFKPTKEELSLPAEILQGAVFTRRWLENNLAGFFIKRGENLHQIGGVAGKYINSPISIKGEWAMSRVEEQNPAQAYYLQMRITDDNLTASYNISNITDDFKEMGVNSFTRGKSQEIDLDFQCTKDFSLQLIHNKYFDSETGKVKNSLIQEIFKYQITQNQFCHIIVEDTMTNWNGTKKVKKDVALGYAYETIPFSFSLGQFVSDTNNRFFKGSVNLDNLLLGAEYKVKESTEGQEHLLNLVSTIKPIEILDINSMIEYEHPFDSQKGNVRFLLNANTFAIPGLTASGQYVHFTRQEHDARSNRYTLNFQYNEMAGRVHKFEFLRINNDTATASSYIQNLVVGTGFPMWKKLEFKYNGELDSYGQKSKFGDWVNNGNHTYIQDLILSYICNDKLTLNSTISYQSANTWNNIFEDGEYQVVYDKRQSHSYGLGFDFEKSFQQMINMEINYEPHQSDPVVFYSGQAKYLLGKVFLDCNGEIEYALKTKRITDSEYNFSVTLPEFLKIEPKFKSLWENKNMDSNNPYIKKSYSMELKYDFEERQSIILEVCRDYLYEPMEEEAVSGISVDNFGVILGLEFGF